MLKDLWKNTKPINEIQINEKDMRLMAIEELNFHMININVKSELAIDYIIDLAQKLFIFFKVYRKFIVFFSKF